MIQAPTQQERRGHVLSTKPDPKLVEQVIDARTRNVLRMSPLFNMTSNQVDMSWADTVKVNRSTSAW